MAVVKVVVSLAVFTLLTTSGRGEAATIAAASCSPAAVQAAVNSAVDGDTIQVPAGTCSWTTQVTVSKGITLQGAGIEQTVLLDSMPGGAYARFPMLVMSTPNVGQNWRLTGITFGPGTTAGVNANGIIVVAGRSHAFRIDHIRMAPGMNTIKFIVYDGDLWGVVDHNQFETTGGVIVHTIDHSSWQGVGTDGDNSWAQPVNWGSQEFIFIEDNVFVSTSSLTGVTDSNQAGRFVFRNNTLTNSSIETHGTESGGRHRSVRAVEVYGNKFTNTSTSGQYTAVHLRGGSGVIFNNTILSGWFGQFLIGDNYRSTINTNPYFGHCDGSSPYDGNTAGLSGYPCLDQVGRGSGVLLSGNTPPLPQAWPRQVPEPVFVWNNSSGVQGMVAAGTPHIQVGRDIILDSKPGYTPYTYPHPLVSGSGSSTAVPAPPSNPAVR